MARWDEWNVTLKGRYGIIGFLEENIMKLSIEQCDFCGKIEDPTKLSHIIIEAKEVDGFKTSDFSIHYRTLLLEYIRSTEVYICTGCFYKGLEKIINS